MDQEEARSEQENEKEKRREKRSRHTTTRRVIGLYTPFSFSFYHIMCLFGYMSPFHFCLSHLRESAGPVVHSSHLFVNWEDLDRIDPRDTVADVRSYNRKRKGACRKGRTMEH